MMSRSKSQRRAEPVERVVRHQLADHLEMIPLEGCRGWREGSRK
jgi:hypothetical protein